MTDSAAAGTALATGNKTKKWRIRCEKDLETKVNSVASWAKKRLPCRYQYQCQRRPYHTGCFLHQGQRSSYYNVGLDLIDANFDFYAGSDFSIHQQKKCRRFNSESLYTLVDKAGYTIARGYKDYQKKQKSDKLILLQPATTTDNIVLSPYRSKKGDMTLTEITRCRNQFPV